MFYLTVVARSQAGALKEGRAEACCLFSPLPESTGLADPQKAAPCP